MSLVNEMIKGLLPENEKRKVVAVYGGGFKPPTSGHFEVAQQALKENPEIDEFIIYIGGKERNGISPDESILIWDIYKQYLPYKVEVKYTSVPPIKSIYNYAKEHPNEDVLFIIGAREGNEDDFKDIASRTTSLDKYPNLNLRTIVTTGGVSGTAARNASKISLDKFKPFVPSELSDEEVEQVYNIVADKIQENNPEDGKAAPYGSGYKKIKEFVSKNKILCDNCGWDWNIKDGGDDLYICHDCGHDNTPRLNENASYSQNINITDQIAKLTNHMIAKGMNIEPLPSLEFIDGDSENAKDFLGKTAYYDPNRQHIVLYTEGRHPKDIVRSYAHEMIHHIQYLEDRLGDIPGTDTTSSDHLDKLEQEANLRGTMTFRNWTDSLKENKVADKDIVNNNSIVAVLSKDDNQISLYNFDNKEPLGLINTAGNEVTGVVAKKGYGPLMYELGMANIYPNGLQSDRNGNTEPKAQAVLNKFIDGASPTIKVVKLTPKDKEYRVEYPNGNEVLDASAYYNYKFYNPNTSTLKQLLQRGKELYPKEQQMIISSTEEMYEDLVNEAKTYKHKSGFNDKLGKDPFGLNQFAREIAEDITEYQVYCDMDGVLTDFELGYEKLTGIDLKGEFQKGEDFWDPISKAGVGFWAGLQWMPGGKELWAYLKPFNPVLLSAPSREQSSRIGKAVWVKHKIPGTKLILRYAKQKQQLATQNSILIDDRQVNIDQWEAAGGIGILHTSTANTIQQLQKLGL